MNKRLKELRKELGLTQQEFADKIGIARGNIAAYEVGKNLPSDAVIGLVCREFHINEQWLRNGIEPKYSIVNDDYTKISVDIDKNDKKARQAIIDYWNLSKKDKELFWCFVDRFLKPKNDGGG